MAAPADDAPPCPTCGDPACKKEGSLACWKRKAEVLQKERDRAITGLRDILTKTDAALAATAGDDDDE